MAKHLGVDKKHFGGIKNYSSTKHFLNYFTKEDRDLQWFIDIALQHTYFEEESFFSFDKDICIISPYVIVLRSFKNPYEILTYKYISNTLDLPSVALEIRVVPENIIFSKTKHTIYHTMIKAMEKALFKKLNWGPKYSEAIPLDNFISLRGLIIQPNYARPLFVLGGKELEELELKPNSNTSNYIKDTKWIEINKSTQLEEDIDKIILEIL
ncbi:MAG: hypothetical protein KAX49_15270 [Halanaerobiales bacterium]|nr:hypothetical protein [Halanaerobiales bacterium]